MAVRTTRPASEVLKLMGEGPFYDVVGDRQGAARMREAAEELRRQAASDSLLGRAGKARAEACLAAAQWHEDAATSVEEKAAARELANKARYLAATLAGRLPSTTAAPVAYASWQENVGDRLNPFADARAGRQAEADDTAREAVAETYLFQVQTILDTATRDLYTAIWNTPRTPDKVFSIPDGGFYEPSQVVPEGDPSAVVRQQGLRADGIVPRQVVETSQGLMTVPSDPTLPLGSVPGVFLGEPWPRPAGHGAADSGASVGTLPGMSGALGAGGLGPGGVLSVDAANRAMTSGSWGSGTMLAGRGIAGIAGPGGATGLLGGSTYGPLPAGTAGTGGLRGGLGSLDSAAAGRAGTGAAGQQPAGAMMYGAGAPGAGGGSGGSTTRPRGWVVEPWVDEWEEERRRRSHWHRSMGPGFTLGSHNGVQGASPPEGITWQREPDAQEPVPWRPRLGIPGWVHIGDDQMHYHEPTHWWYDAKKRTFWHARWAVDVWIEADPEDWGSPNTQVEPPLRGRLFGEEVYIKAGMEPPARIDPDGPHVDPAAGWQWDERAGCWIEPTSSWWWYPYGNFWREPHRGMWYRLVFMPDPIGTDPVSIWFDKMHMRRLRRREERLCLKEQHERARQAKRERREQARLVAS